MYEYRSFASYQLSRLQRSVAEPFTRYPCVVPQWDNTARWKSSGANILHRSSPELYQGWLKQVIAWTMKEFDTENQLVFLNAWNEWGEGAYLEPDIKYGRAYLESTKQALLDNGIEVTGFADTKTESPGATSPEERNRLLLDKIGQIQRQLENFQTREEYSPLLKRAEHRYTELQEDYKRLDVKFRRLRNESNELNRRLEVSENAKLQGTLDQGIVNDVSLGNAIQQLEDQVNALFESRRWKLSDSVLKSIKAIRGQKEEQTIEADIKRSISKLRGRL